MFTLSQLQTLKEKGLIKDFTQPTKAKEGQLIAPQGKKGQKIKGWIALNLKVWCEANGFTLETEYKFHPERKWRFDFWLPELKTAIEYEGLMSEKSRHTTKTGYSGDADKYTAAAIMGIKVLRYTALNYKNILKDLETLNKAS